MFKNISSLVMIASLGICASAQAIESHSSSMRCFSIDEGEVGLALQYENSSDNVQASDTNEDLHLNFNSVQHHFQGKQLPKVAKVEINNSNDESDSLISVSASYLAKDADIILSVDASSIKQDSYDGTPGNDLSTYSFPGTISVKVKTPGNENSYQESVRCRVELTSRGMAG